MSARLENFGYGTAWRDVSTDYYEGYLPRMTDYHMHDYYELSLILSGNVQILLSDKTERIDGPRLLLLRPRTAHYVLCEQNQVYRRQNLLFSDAFLREYSTDFQNIISVFKKNGNVLSLNESDAQKFLIVMREIERETDALRKKLLLLYLISLANSIGSSNENQAMALPPFICGALDYIAEHYGERIVAHELAWKLYVSRTTLMTNFRKYTGVTLGDYVARYRLSRAVAMLKAGEGEPETARLCGFGDCSTMIRTFKRYLGMPPRRYLYSLGGEQNF
jgi:AraC-like DNA-binding protein